MSHRIQNIICYSCANKNVDIKFNAHDALLNYPSSCTLKVERFESKYTEYTLCNISGFGFMPQAATCVT